MTYVYILVMSGHSGRCPEKRGSKGYGVSVPAVGKTPFSGNTPFSSQTGGKQVQNASFREISVLALQNAPRLHANHTKARSNGVFPTAGTHIYWYSEFGL